MFKVLFFLLYSGISLLASNVVELYYNSHAITDFKVSYVLDLDDSISLENIHTQKFKTATNIHSFGTSTKTAWIKLEVHNMTANDQDMFLHNDFAYFSKNIIIYEFKNSTLYNQEVVNVLASRESNKLVGRTLVYPFEVQNNHTTTLYLKITPMVSHLYNLKIYDYKHHLEALIKKDFTYITIVLVLFSLALYNIFLYFFTKRKEMLYYAFYLINASLGLLYMYGVVFSVFSLYGKELYLFNLFAISVSFLLLLFVESIFNFKKKNPRIYRLIFIQYILVLLQFLVAIFFSLQLVLDLLGIFFLYTCFLIIYITYQLIKEKHPLATVFLVAYSVYIIGFAFTIAAMLGLIQMSELIFHGSGLGLVIEALLFSYIIHFHIKLLEQKISDQDNHLIYKNQKEQMGDMIGAIVHQWKQPLNKISSALILIQFKLDDKIHDPDYLRKKTAMIDKSVHFLADTITDFREFFRDNKTKKSCDLNLLLHKAIDLSKDDTLTDQVRVKLDLNFTKTVEVYENELLHVVLNIVQNAKDAFKENVNSSDLKLIKIIGETTQDYSSISIIDNAGGIPKENIPYVFKEKFTTKASSDGTGYGLYLSKIIVEEHLQGSIEVKNIGDGTMFRIKL